MRRSLLPQILREFAQVPVVQYAFYADIFVIFVVVVSIIVVSAVILILIYNAHDIVNTDIPMKNAGLIRLVMSCPW